MRKRWFLIAMTFLLTPWLMTGCGVAQEEYDELKNTLVTTQASLEQIKNTLVEREASINRLESQVDQLNKDLSSAVMNGMN